MKGGWGGPPMAGCGLLFDFGASSDFQLSVEGFGSLAVRVQGCP